MSWLNISGNLSSLATNVSSFTREVLTEAKNESYNDDGESSENEDDERESNHYANGYQPVNDDQLSFQTLQDELNLLKTELSLKDDEIYILQQDNNEIQREHDNHMEKLKDCTVKMKDLKTKHDLQLNELKAKHEVTLNSIIQEKDSLEMQFIENSEKTNNVENSWEGDWSEDKVDVDELEKTRSENESLSNEVMMKEIILNSIEAKMNEISKSKVDVADFTTWLDDIITKPNTNDDIFGILSESMENSDNHFDAMNPVHVKQWLSEILHQNTLYKQKLEEAGKTISDVESSMVSYSKEDYGISQFNEWLQHVNNSEHEKQDHSDDMRILRQIETEIRELDDEYENFEIGNFHEWLEKTQCQRDELEVELLNEQETRENEEEQRGIERAKLNELFTEKQNEIRLLKVELYNKTASPHSPVESDPSESIDSQSLVVLQEQLSEGNARCQGLQDELLCLQRRNDDLSTSQDEMDDVVLKLENSKNELHDSLTEKTNIENQLLAAETKLKLLEKELLSEQDHNKELEEQLNNLKLQNQDTEEQTNEFNTQYNETQQQLYTSQIQLDESAKNYELLYHQFNATSENNNELRNSLTEKHQELNTLMTNVKSIETILNEMKLKDTPIDIGNIERTDETFSLICTSLQDLSERYSKRSQILEDRNNEINKLKENLSEKIKETELSNSQASCSMDILITIASVLDEIQLSDTSYNLVSNNQLSSTEPSFYESYMEFFKNAVGNLIDDRKQLLLKNNEAENTSTLHRSEMNENEQVVVVEESFNAENIQEVNTENSDGWDNSDDWGFDGEINQDTNRAVHDNNDSSKQVELTSKLEEIELLLEQQKQENLSYRKESEELNLKITELEKTLFEQQRTLQNNTPPPSSSGGGMKFGALKKKIKELEILNETLLRENAELKVNDASQAGAPSLPQPLPSSSVETLLIISCALEEIQIQLNSKQQQQLVFDNQLLSTEPSFYKSYMESFKSVVNDIIGKNNALNSKITLFETSAQYEQTSNEMETQTLNDEKIQNSNTDMIVENIEVQNIEELNSDNPDVWNDGWDSNFDKATAIPNTNKDAAFSKLTEELSETKKILETQYQINGTYKKNIEELNLKITELEKTFEQQRTLQNNTPPPSSSGGGMKFGALKKKIKELEILNETLLRENEDLQSLKKNIDCVQSVHENDIQIQNLTKLLSEKSSECQYYYEESEQLKESVMSMQKDMQTIQDECYQLKTMLHDQQNQQMFTMQSQNELQVNAHSPSQGAQSSMHQQDQLHNLSLRLTDKSEECEKLQHECEYLNSKVVELQNETSDLELIREECKQLKAMLMGKEHQTRVDETISMLQTESKQLKHLLIEKDAEYQQLQKFLIEKENELSDMGLLREECAQLKQMLMMQGSTDGINPSQQSYKRLETSLYEREEEIRQKDAMLVEMNNSYSDMELLREECKQLKIMLKDQNNISLQSSNTEKESHIQTSEKDDNYMRLEAMLQERENEILKKEAVINDLQNSVSDIELMREESKQLKDMLYEKEQQSILSNESVNTSTVVDDDSQNSFLLQVQQLEEFLKEKDQDIEKKENELKQKDQEIIDMELLHNECKALKQMIVEKEQIFSELQNDLDAANDVLQSKNEELKIKNDECVDVKGKFNNAIETIKVKENEYALLQEELTESMVQDENIHLLQTEYRNVDEQLQETQKDLNACQEQLFASETQCERLNIYKEQYKGLKEALQEREEALNALQLQSSENSILESETVGLLQKELNGVKTLIYERENHINDLTVTLEKKTIELQNIYNESRETINTLETKLKESHNHVERLNSEFESLEQLSKERLETENHLTEKVNALIASENSNAAQVENTNEMNELKRLLKQEKVKSSDAENRLGERLSKLSDQESYINQLNIDIEAEQEEISVYQNRISVLELKLQEMPYPKENTESEFLQTSHNDQPNNSCENCVQLQTERNEFVTILKQIKESLALGNVQQSATILTDLREIHYSVDKLLTEVTLFKKQCAILEDDANTLNEKLNNQANDHETSFTKTNEDYEYRIKDLQSQLQELSELQADYQAISAEKKHLQEQFLILQNKNTEISSQLDDEKQKRSKDSEMAALQVVSLEEQLYQLQEEYQKRIKESESTANSAVVAECERMREELQQNSHSYLAKNKECDALKLDILQLEDKVYNYEMSNEKFKHYDEEIQKFKNLQNENNELRSSLEDCQVKIESSQKEKAFLEELIQVKGQLEQDKEEYSFQNNHLTLRVQEQDVLLKHKDINYREVEAKATRELERLRNHLMMIEENHTKDIMELQERESKLQQQLNDSKQVLSKKSIILQHSSKQFQEHVVDLEEQLHVLASQRDTQTLELSKCHEKIQYDAHAIYNLQSALEQLQKDKDDQSDYLMSVSKRKEMELNESIHNLTNEQQHAKATMNEASLAVQGISKLTLELQQKENELKVEKEKTNDLLTSLKEKDIQCNTMIAASEKKMDKSLLRNLLLKYFQSTEEKRADIVHIIGGLLGMSHEEIQQIGSGAVPSKVGGWISNVWGFGTPKKPVQPPATPGKYDSNKSFSELFVKFLEHESETSAPIDSTASLTISNEVPNPSNIHMLSPVTPDILAFHNNRNQLVVDSGQRIPAPGQEIPRVHTHHAQSTLKNLLA